MNLFAWLLLGLIAGSIALATDPAACGSGILDTLVLGINRIRAAA